MNRRRFLKSSALFGISVLGVKALTGCSYSYPGSRRRQPNVILISADDLGYGDLSCYGSDDIPTPNIDRIAAEGTLFTRFYSSSPVCTPARACMLTGLYPQRTGMNQVLMGEGGLKDETVLISEVLSRNGYTTASIGKWHLGYEGASLPNRQGFDYFYGHRGGKIDFYKHTDDAQKVEGDPLGRHDLYENDTEVFHEGYTTNLFTNKAISFIKANKDRPFFLNLPYNTPHYARGGVLQAPPEYIKRFTDAETPSLRDMYRAMVACMDDGIGDIYAALKALNILDNTLLVFVSDNGADPKHGGSNGPFRGGKWTLWEGGIRVPLVMRLPHCPGPKKEIAQPVHMVDLFPTILDVCRVEYNGTLDGVSLVKPVCDGGQLDDRCLYFAYQSYTAVCGDRYKLLIRRDEKYLFDLLNDLEEKKNMIEEHPDIAQSLETKLNAFLASVQDDK